MAQADEKLLIQTKELMIKKYPRFASEIAKAKLSYRKDLPHHSAATDGQNLFFDPDFMLKLTEDERLFIIAHELMHVKFEHMYRIKDKDGKMRNPYIWNIATDCLVDVYDVGDYRKIILPMFVIRRFDAVLEPVHDKVVEMRKQLEKLDDKSVDIEPALCSVAGQAFVNSSDQIVKLFCGFCTVDFTLFFG